MLFDTSQPAGRLGGGRLSLCAVAGLLALVLSFWYPVGRSAQGQPIKDLTCSQVTWPVRPGWTGSAAWTPANELLVVDSLYNRILLYGPEGRFNRYLDAAKNQLVQKFLPSSVRRAGDDIILELASSRLFLLGPNLETRKVVDVFRSSKSERGGLDSLFQWTLMEGNEIFGFGDSYYPDEEAEDGKGWRMGRFFRVPLDDPAQFVEIGLAPTSVSEVSSVQFRLGHYLTSIDDRAYTLLFPGEGVKGGLYVSGPNESKLTLVGRSNSFLSDFEPLPEFGSSSTFRRTMAAVEKASSMPTGLFSWQDDLYILWRKFKNNSVQWSLRKVDPNTGELVGSVGLPTSATHLTVAVGDKAWAFVEKGPVVTFGVQDVNGALIVPSGLVKSMQGCSSLQ